MLERTDLNIVDQMIAGTLGPIKSEIKQPKQGANQMDYLIKNIFVTEAPPSGKENAALRMEAYGKFVIRETGNQKEKSK